MTGHVGPSPQFRLVVQPSLYRSICDSLSALCETEPPVNPVRLNGGMPWPRERSLLPAFLTSLLLYFAVIFFLYSVPFAWLFRRFRTSRFEPQPQHYKVVVYKLQVVNLADLLPAELPPQPGGAPGAGASAGARAPHGSSAWDPRVNIVSNPKRPDNFHQTILQRAAPPKVKLLKDVQLPDLVIPTTPPVRVAPQPMPLQKLTAAPPLELPPLPMPAPAEPPPARPALPLPLPTALPLAPLLALNQILPPPVPAPAVTHQSPTVAQHLTVAQGSAKLLSLSVNPAPLKNVLAIPLGNRLGSFSVSPAGSRKGSPGGVPGSRAGPGTQGSGSGGDMSVGAGPGGQGGGGSSASPAGGALSVAGISGAASGEGALPPLRAEALVYPVNSAKPGREPALIVSTGPGGGGGLGVYGVLHCGRIFTRYLPMAPRRWILQYCAPQTDPPAISTSNVVEIRMQAPLAPPSPVRQFDFHRLARANDGLAQMIILHGTIGKDGSVGGLKLLRGVQATINQAAMAAFGRWKFSPALRGGKPVAVEILVGIPVAAE